MEIQKLQSSDSELSFVIKGITPEIANSLRRIMIGEVPTLAIDEIDFQKNDSALYDEVLAHRFGLVPLVTDLSSYEMKETCSCEGAGCAKCQLVMSLKAKGPATVYSSELQSTDPKVKPVFPNIPLVILVKQQRLEIEATAILGQGKVHMKFAPCIAYYTTENENDFTFYIESFGQLAPLEIFETALSIFNDKLEQFEAGLKGEKGSKLSMLKKIKVPKLKK